MYFVIVFVLLRLGFVAIRATSDVISDKYLIHASKDLRLDVFSNLHHLDFAFHADKNSGTLISAMKRGDGAFWSLTLQTSRYVIEVFIDLVFVLIAFWSVNTDLIVVILIGFGLNLLFMIFLIRINLRARRGVNDQEDRIFGIVADNMLNYETVKFFANEEKEKNRLDNENWTLVDRIWAFAMTFRVIEVWLGLVIAISLAAIFIISTDSVDNGSMSIGDFALVLTFSLTFFPRLGDLIFRFREIAKAQTDFERYANLLEYPVKVQEKPSAKDLMINRGEINFEEITFEYNKNEGVLDHFNLTIKPQETIAFVGTSGAGKTTLIKLLLRFYDVLSGSIKIDNQDIRDVTKKSLRKNIAIVPQEAMLFNNTIGFNIGYAKKDATIDEIKKAAELANLADFIESLPKGYDTMVGERGIKLSGGQKQRLAIARAIIENPPIIVFDEATSQLDSKSEKLIQEAFWELSKDKTTIVIAHRLSTIMRADRIIVLSNGKIVEEGKHDELISKQAGIYRNLWDLQTGELRD